MRLFRKRFVERGGIRKVRIVGLVGEPTEFVPYGDGEIVGDGLLYEFRVEGDTLVMVQRAPSLSMDDRTLLAFARSRGLIPPPPEPLVKKPPATEMRGI